MASFCILKQFLEGILDKVSAIELKIDIFTGVSYRSYLNIFKTFFEIVVSYYIVVT